MRPWVSLPTGRRAEGWLIWRLRAARRARAGGPRAGVRRPSGPALRRASARRVRVDPTRKRSDSNAWSSRRTRPRGGGRASTGRPRGGDVDAGLRRRQACALDRCFEAPLHLRSRHPGCLLQELAERRASTGVGADLLVRREAEHQRLVVRALDVRGGHRCRSSPEPPQNVTKKQRLRHASPGTGRPRGWCRDP